MVITSKIKSVDFFRKIPRDLTEASLSGAGLSLMAAFSMMFLFGMELHNYLDITTTTSVIVDQSSDSDFLLIGFNLSFPALSCEFASVDVSDVLGTNRLNITKTVRKYSINKHLESTGPEFDPVPTSTIIKHDVKVDEEYGEGSVTLNSQNFDKIAHQYSVLVVNFYAPWCDWCNRLKPSWEKAAKIIRERHNPETDGRIILGKVNCTEERDLCRSLFSHHVQAYPSIRIFRRGSDVRDEHGNHDHESYYGDRNTDSLVEAMEHLVAPNNSESRKLSLHDRYGQSKVFEKRPAPREAGCRIEGFVRVKKVPGSIIVSPRSESHSFDASQINMSHVISSFNFGKKVTPKTMSDLKRLRHYIESHDKLAGKSYINVEDHADVTIEHYLQVVKTEVMSSSYQLIEDYEYTAHSSLVHALTIPVAKFHFEPSPMQILVTEDPKSFSHFITNVCAIIGGVFTVAGILDSLLHNTMRLAKKIELGKTF
uniref:Protein disulfide isomerase-like 5-4 n=1 Tax=Tanacetum cinerariifolium TaxID=118510 RepID=A0A6L2P429_TANCI|nr:protein disulfide isomerase-like 5-4 [Tanacetum cinerariifolium]